jgi:glutamate racemase
MNKSIGIFDSGIGGLTTLKEIKKILPNEDYIYYADSKNNPFGEKSKKELNIIVHNIINELLKYNVKLIVIACNTVTTRFINALRKEYSNILFVGVEPAIKVACDNNYKNTLLMATPNTISSKRTNELISKNKKDDQNIYLVSCEGLANSIENNNYNKIDKILNYNLNKYKDYNIDSIVLGCTHYPIIKNRIKKYFPNSKLIDGNKGTAKRVKYLLEKNNLLNKSNKKGSVRFIQTKR